MKALAMRLTPFKGVGKVSMFVDKVSKWRQEKRVRVSTNSLLKNLSVLLDLLNGKLFELSVDRLGDLHRLHLPLVDLLLAGELCC